MYVVTPYRLSLGTRNRSMSSSTGRFPPLYTLWCPTTNFHVAVDRVRLEDYAAGPDVDFSNVLRLFFDRTGNLTTTTFYLQNTNSLIDDRLKLTYGAKYLHIGAEFRNNGKTIANAQSAPDLTRPNLSLPTDGGFLPQLGLVFSVTPLEQLFANFSQNVNAYPYSPQSGVYNTNPQGFQLLKDRTDPEEARTYEVGLRTRRSGVEASLAGYYIDYRNRLIGVSVCPLTATCVSSFANVGGVTSRGVEGLLALHIADRITWQSSGSYNRSTIDDDYEDGQNLIPSSGKDVVDAPRVMLNSSVRVARGPLIGSFGARHVAKRYFTILNTMSVPSYTVFDASAGFRLSRLSALKDLTLQLNAANLFDESYIASMGTGGFSVRDDLQTLQTGARRLVFVTIGTSF
jgi:iron complex outermembrane receptor protein